MDPFDDEVTRLPERETKAHTLEAGQVFGQFEILSMLGRGGMGEVYEARHTVLGTTYALKVINREILTEVNRERFKREAQVMAQLLHPNIVQVDDFGETEGYTWLRMQLLRGFEYEGDNYASLDALMEAKGALPESYVRKVLKQVLQGLRFAHAKGVVHRDIKPSNVLFDGEGTARVTDFGLVRLAGEDFIQSQVKLTQAGDYDEAATELEKAGSQAGSKTRALLGTFSYMSPEQKKSSEVDHRSDLYAVGLIGFQMLTGEDSSALELPSSIVDGIDPGWDDWVKQAMASSREKRFADAGAMIAGLPGEEEVVTPVIREESVRQEASEVEEPEALREEIRSIAATKPNTGKSSASKWVLVILSLVIIGCVVVWIFKPQGKSDTEVNADPAQLSAVAEDPTTTPAPTVEQPEMGQPWQVTLGDGVVADLVWIPAGRFTMGSPTSEPNRDDDEAEHLVEITKSFWLGKTEVTLEQYAAYLKAARPEGGLDWDDEDVPLQQDSYNLAGNTYSESWDQPVVELSWRDAVGFCQWLTQVEREAGRLPQGYVYDLPTEAQWEYACRAGGEGKPSVEAPGRVDQIGAVAWHAENSGGMTRSVRQKMPNAWGLHDMYGNVYEWCRDYYGPYPPDDSIYRDPVGPASGSRRVFRGGDWATAPDALRSSFRKSAPEGASSINLGFRVALVPDTSSQR